MFVFNLFNCYARPSFVTICAVSLLGRTTPWHYEADYGSQCKVLANVISENILANVGFSEHQNSK